jgi:DnaJ-class molecular chaperone
VNPVGTLSLKEPQCGKHPWAQMLEVDCSKCGGQGEVERDDGYGPDEEWIICWLCKGNGNAPWLECQGCLEEFYDTENM